MVYSHIKSFGSTSQVSPLLPVTLGVRVSDRSPVKITSLGRSRPPALILSCLGSHTGLYLVICFLGQLSRSKASRPGFRFFYLVSTVCLFLCTAVVRVFVSRSPHFLVHVTTLGMGHHQALASMVLMHTAPFVCFMVRESPQARGTCRQTSTVLMEESRCFGLKLM